jgi:hypothetical protein
MTQIDDFTPSRNAAKWKKRIPIKDSPRSDDMNKAKFVDYFASFFADWRLCVSCDCFICRDNPSISAELAGIFERTAFRDQRWRVAKP